MFVAKSNLLIGVVTVSFAVYAAWQALVIAQAGVINQIPQLEGDGGGALLFAVVLAAAGIVGLWKPIAALPLYGVALLIGVVAALIYQDLMLWFWDFGTVILGTVTVVGVRKMRQKRAQAGAA